MMFSPLVFCTLALAGLLAGCASAPAERFYTLAAEAPPSGPAPASPYSVVVGPVVLPATVDRAQLVVGAGANQVAILELQRWAAPLKSEIARVIAADLSRLLGTQQAGTDAQNVITHPDYRVTVDVLRFDAALGGAVAVEALWVVRTAGGALSNGRSQVSETTQGDDYAAVVAAQSRALAVVSRDIAEAIRGQRMAAH